MSRVIILHPGVPASVERPWSPADDLTIRISQPAFSLFCFCLVAAIVVAALLLRLERRPASRAGRR